MGHYSKVKSRSHHDVAHLQPLTNVPTKYQLPTCYGFRDIDRARFYRSRSLRKGQINVTSLRCTPTTPNQCIYQVSTSYTLRFPRYSPDKIFKLKVTTARSKVKSRSHHDVAHLHPLTNVPTKYQLSTLYGFRDTGRTNFSPPPAHPDTMGENNTPTAIKSGGVKTKKWIRIRITAFYWCNISSVY